MTSIAAERDLYKKVGFTHRLREQWGAKFNYTTTRGVAEPASYQFVHITITDPDRYPSDDAHARAVEAIGISRFPNTGISYNELVMPGGKLYEAQPMGRRGAHTVNDDQRSTCGTAGCPSRGTGLSAPSFNLNINARAISLARNVDDPVTDADVDAVARWCAAGRLTGMVRKDAHIHGHRCVSSKSCPGDKAWTRMDDIHDLTSDYLKQGLGEDMPTAQEIADAVWADPRGNLQSDKATAAGTLLTWIHKHVVDTKTGVAVLLGRDSADVDEAALAAALAPLLAGVDTATLLAAIQGLPAETAAAIKAAL